MAKHEQVIVAGFGGQGVMLMGQMLAYAATNEGLNTVWIPSYGPETRGGTANCSIAISDKMINSPVVTRPDSVVALNLPSLEKFEPKLKKDGLLIVNDAAIKDYEYRDDVRLITIDANKEALALGNLRVANMIMLGAYIQATGIFKKDAIIEVFKKTFSGDKAKLMDINVKALETGMKLAA